jgi:hypothetical protein
MMRLGRRGRGIAEVIGVIMVLAAVIMGTAIMMYYSSISISSISADSTTQFTRQTDRALESVSFIIANSTDHGYFMVSIYNSGSSDFYLMPAAAPRGSAYAIYNVGGQFMTPIAVSCTLNSGALFIPTDICILKFLGYVGPGQTVILETSNGAVFSTITS